MAKQTSRLKSLPYLILIVVVLITAAVFLFHHTYSKKPTAKVRRGPIVEAVYGIGTVMANRSFVLRPGVTSTVTEVYVQEGDPVKKDQSLINLDGLVYRAPFSGTVNYLPHKVGENIFAQSSVLSVIDLSNRYLVVSLEQEGALRTQRGQKAQLSFDSIRGENFEGVVEAVYSLNQDFLARIGISHLHPRILPGMTADVAIAIRENKDALLVPISALDGDKVHRDGSEVKVKIGISDGAFAELLSGDLRVGDELEIKLRPDK